MVFVEKYCINLPNNINIENTKSKMLCYINFEMLPLKFIYITLNNLDAIQSIGINKEKQTIVFLHEDQRFHKAHQPINLWQ